MSNAVGQGFMGGDDFFFCGKAMKNIEFGLCVSRFDVENLHVTRQVVVEARQVFAQALMVDRFLAEVPVHRVNQKARVGRGDTPACRQEHDDAH
ncbi:hypothetical protein D3C81_2044400 [compost metagenome]